MAMPQMERTGVFDRLLKDRIVWLGSEVRDENANEICAKILLLAAEDSEKDIFLYINSPGGSITAGMAIYDTMQYVPNDIVTVGIGMAASMGQFFCPPVPRASDTPPLTPGFCFTSQPAASVEPRQTFRPRPS